MLYIRKSEKMLIIGKSGKLSKIYDWFCIFMYIALQALNSKYIESSAISFMLLFLFFVVFFYNIELREKIIKDEEELSEEINNFLQK